MSFSFFLRQLVTNPALLITVLLTLGVICVNGITDAPNAIATCVSTRSLDVNLAIVMAAVCNCAGVVVMTMVNSTVAMTITNMVNFGEDTSIALVALCAALFSIVVWSSFAVSIGCPTSESHALIAGLTGAAVAIRGGFSAINSAEWMKVVYGLIFSVVLGFLSGYLSCKLVAWTCRDMDRRKTTGFFRYAQIGGAAAMAFMHGAQDGQKFTTALFWRKIMRQRNTVSLRENPYGWPARNALISSLHRPVMSVIFSFPRLPMKSMRNIPIKWKPSDWMNVGWMSLVPHTFLEPGKIWRMIFAAG